MSRMLDAYWNNYERCFDKIRDHGHTVEDVIRILNEHWDISSGDAFTPSGGDRTLAGVLAWERDDWYFVWAEDDYYCCLADSQGNRLTYVEGDVYRGNTRPTPAQEGATQ